ncbi:major facilitator superfamily transporter [Arthroderma uncinatum]|uniref:major facilitator superfamily transporter n=1 Tax=Arthroderma uncinatum TaxID=74035 RepID=UPI00144AAFC8|nr:major facilitator superfamily transporter [Arthroderma uncinatum]KAF3480958.1 major facilitator superfamily transporter [Arthroderma uncinatum]
MGEPERKSIDEESGGEKSVEKHDDSQYPPTKKVIPIMIALYLVVFLIALDRTIIATAIPRITDQFHSIDDIGWYGSSYLLTGCSFMLLFGKIYSLYSPKWVYLAAIVIFEIGSAVCGAAPNSTAFIIGRAIAGLGSAGAFSGTVIIIVHAVPLRKRPAYTGMMGGMFGIASVAGPLLGGLFTDKVSWRWCFYINLPIGAVTLLIVTFLLHVNIPGKSVKGLTVYQQFLKLDPLGTLCFMPSVICLLLALQWGGTTYSWGNGRIIGLFVVFAILLIAFIIIQIWRKEDATVPPRIFVQRSVLSAFWFTICIGSSMMTIIYYLPLWFQAIKGVSAVKSGIMNLPMILSLVIGVIMSGGLVTAIGYYAPFMIACCILSSVGAGLLTTFMPDTGHAKWIGYQVIYGLGLGMGMQQGSVACQTVLSKADVPVGSSLIFFAQQLGGTVFIAVAQNIFTNKLTSGLQHIPGLNPGMLAQVGATTIRDLVKDPEVLREVLKVYNVAVVNTYYIAVAMSCAAIVGALTIEWKSVKGEEKK